MAQVSVTIGGRQFRLACEDGEEEHLKVLADELAARVEDLRSRFGEIGDSRLTLMAALTLADELADTGRRLSRLEDEIAKMKNAYSVAASRDRAKDEAVASALNVAAERIEALARRINQGLTGNVPHG